MIISIYSFIAIIAYNIQLSISVIIILSLGVDLPMSQVERVKKITLKDHKNKQQQYMMSERILGKGKYGKVYKAIHVDNPDKVFAVKVIQFSSQKAKQQYLKELQIIRHLPKSLNLVQIHSQHLQSKNNFYLFEQFCDGGNLYEQAIARKGKLYTQQEAYNLFFQVVNGFLDLRKANIFHEDIKPQNILIKNNLYKLTDFGISQLQNKVQVSEIRRGTLIYMPPQKLKGNNYIPTSKSQIFSLGVTLYEVMFGHHPYLNKRPSDYKEYLKLIQQTQLRSPQQLKNVFTTRSLSLDKLIRTILRMIELRQGSRLSLQELTQYVTNTEPFKSMQISEVQPMAKKKVDKNMKFQEVAKSHVIVKSQHGMGSLLIEKNSKNKLRQNFKILMDTYKICLQLFRDSSGFIQQGLFYSKNSNIYELKKVQIKSSIELNKVPRLTQLQFACLLFIQRIFLQFQTSFENILFQSQIESNQYEGIQSSIQEDVQFISNQFLKFFTQIDVQNKKEVRTSLKQNKIQLSSFIISALRQAFQNVTCVRVNFRHDILSILFLKFAPPIFQLLEKISEQIRKGQKDDILKILASKQYEQVKQKLLQFSSAEIQKKQKLAKTFQVNMMGHEILEDDQSNSDEFQLLQFDDE